VSLEQIEREIFAHHPAQKLDSSLAMLACTTYRQFRELTADIASAFNDIRKLGSETPGFAGQGDIDGGWLDEEQAIISRRRARPGTRFASGTLAGVVGSPIPSDALSSVLNDLVS
jgi:hypothetical protein